VDKKKDKIKIKKKKKKKGERAYLPNLRLAE
jgi:hypothetical protein